jgi:PAS domain S-box-containing protein
MKRSEIAYSSIEDLQKELEELRLQMNEANDTIEAIRTGQIDAFVVQNNGEHQLYTLKTADHTYRVFIEKMSEGAVTLNHQGLILYCNSRFAAMVNLPLSQVIGVSFENFISNEFNLFYKQLFENCWKEDCKGEVMLITGEEKTPVQLSLATMELNEGLSISIIITDLSLQKATQLQLQKNNQELEDVNKAIESSNHDLQQFASVASHDLQEPLRKIQIFSNMMMDKESELTPELKKYLSKIIISSARMKSLILDILNYSGLSADNSKFERINLKELITDLLEDFELIIQEKNAEIIIGELPSADVIKGQIRQVLQNIINNALKFSKHDVRPQINIDAKRLAEKSFESKEAAEGPYCLICIRDNGIGFDEKYVKTIFELFERLHTKDEFEGTGIGLAIAKKIIDKHDGLIRARSKEGEGSEFYIIIPVAQKAIAS